MTVKQLKEQLEKVIEKYGEDLEVIQYNSMLDGYQSITYDELTVGIYKNWIDFEDTEENPNAVLV